MSDMEYHFGKLREVAQNEKTFEDKINYIKKTYKDVKIEDLDIEDSFFHCEDFTYLNGRMFEISDNGFDPDDMEEMEKIGEGEYSYRMSFYNGGGDLSECLEDGLNELENKTNQ